MYHRVCGQSSYALYRASRGNGFDDHYDRYDRYGRYYECTIECVGRVLIPYTVPVLMTIMTVMTVMAVMAVSMNVP
jgi:hypothetical protein